MVQGRSLHQVVEDLAHEVERRSVPPGMFRATFLDPGCGIGDRGHPRCSSLPNQTSSHVVRFRSISCRRDYSPTGARVEAVKRCRGIGKRDMKLNDKLPQVTVDPETYEVSLWMVVCDAGSWRRDVQYLKS